MSSESFLHIGDVSLTPPLLEPEGNGREQTPEHSYMEEYKALVTALQDHPRASITSLAASLQQPRASVTAQLKDLLGKGSIRVLGALHPKFQGITVIAHISVVTNGPITEVAKLAASLDEAVFVSAVTGDFGMVFELRLHSHNELYSLLEQFRTHPSVSSVTTTIYSRILRGAVSHPEHEPITIDTLDETLISQLQLDGRTSLRQLATAAGLSSSATKARLDRLLSSRVVKIEVVEAHGLLGSRFTLGVGLGLRGNSQEVRDFLLEAKSVDFAAECVGAYDAIATITGNSPRELFTELEHLRSFTDVSRINCWVHLRSIKEDYVSRATSTAPPPTASFQGHSRGGDPAGSKIR